MRSLGILGIFIGALAAAGELMKLSLPTVRWFFETSREIPWLNAGSKNSPWFGWLCAGLFFAAGLWLFVGSFLSGARNPITTRRLKRFREVKRGYWSLVILIGLAALAAMDQAVVGKRALAVQHDGQWVFPAFMPRELKNKDFGVAGPTADAPADYRKFKREWRGIKDSRVIMPLIPYDPTGDTLPPRSRELLDREGVYHESGESGPYFGLAAKYYDSSEGLMHLRYTMRNGTITGPADGWDKEGMPVYSAEYQDNQLVSDRYNGSGAKEDFLALDTSDLRAVKYHPAPPIPEEGNWLGTTSQGYDVLAYLYGGLQVNFKAAIIYLPVVYFLGICIGMTMGYFGGWFDLIVQRLIEIFSNLPFLFVVIIFSSFVPERYKGLPIIMTILMLFGWMGITYLMRTAAYRDKERDYVSAARVLGARTPRILFRHLLPNTVAIIVTLVPFTMSSLISSLTSLDYLGFGLPPKYATWGRLLNDGLSNLSAPWLVTSTFVVLVGLLVLITFVGEAVREAFDPKKFTYYR